MRWLFDSYLKITPLLCHNYNIVVECNHCCLMPLFIWRKVVLSKKVSFPAKSTLAVIYMRKNFACVKSWLSTDNSASACSDSLALTELTQLSEPKCSFGEKLARLGVTCMSAKMRQMSCR